MIKIYAVKNKGLIVGEKIKQDDESVYLKYPGIIFPNQETKQGFQHLMAPPIPEFFAGQWEMLKEFKIEKKDITLSGTPSQQIMDLYEDYLKINREKITGIKEAGADALAHLPKNAKGDPIIQ